MKIFGNSEGKVVAISSGHGAGVALIKVGGMPATAAIITGVGFGQGSNVQFMHTLKNKIYVYAFGERMGEIEVSGLFFYDGCTLGKNQGKQLVDYYKANSVSKKAEPVTITLFGATIRGFLREISVKGQDPAGGFGVWMLRFSGLPV